MVAGRSGFRPVPGSVGRVAGKGVGLDEDSALGVGVWLN